MKKYLLICFITLAIHGMNLETYPQKKNESYFKELCMSFQEDPKARQIVKTCGTILFTLGLFCPRLALGTATVTGLSTLLIYYQDREKAIQERKKVNAELAFSAFALGPAGSIERACRADEYLQTDKESLKHQNTIYLIELLKQYDPHHRNAENHQIALNTLMHYHADISYARSHFKNQRNYTHALTWLESAPAPN